MAIIAKQRASHSYSAFKPPWEGRIAFLSFRVYANHTGTHVRWHARATWRLYAAHWTIDYFQAVNAMA